MTSSTPESKTSSTPESNANADEQFPARDAPSAGPPLWRRRWFEPIVVAAIIVALVVALVMGVTSMFESVKEEIGFVKGDLNAAEIRLREEIQASEARLNKQIAEVKTDFKTETTELRAEVKELRGDFKDLRAEFKAEMSQNSAELRADNKIMGDKLDRLLEVLAAPGDSTPASDTPPGKGLQGGVGSPS
ncbi:MAG: hypothetical protein TE42_07275 [Candidatus Synechococcus spongiarum SP3]|uniref:Uncharacterized protein n=1 Tax=Candidatus Synechococcus spongiarum SP3 TaxID=1604020 RepID=A0A0G2J4I6_9SYNE|nr:MAG: hypothetical protein TE42_07275 [Candidatus Synechococcus spongiarum SP3]